MKRVIYSAILLFFLINDTFSQHVQSSLLNDGDEILLDLLPENGLVYEHTIQKGHTVYSLAKYFQIKIPDVLKLNKLESTNSLNLGQTVVIPFDPRIMFKGTDLKSIKYGIYIPVYYMVKAKDNLFRLSKFIFDQPIESLMNRNNLTSYDLSVGQRLLVGWMPIDSDKRVNYPEGIGSISSKIKFTDTIGIYKKNELFNPDIATQRDNRILSRSKGIAIWDRNSSDHNNMFALHSNAKSNSIIEIYNPLLNRTAYATVVGSIPSESYPSDVSLIISPKVAKALGALDSRFLVELKFYQ